MSWHGPYAPRVDGMATKSRVVASCRSNPASTASRMRCWVSLVIIVSGIPLVGQPIQSQFRCGVQAFWRRFQNHRGPPTLTHVLLGCELNGEEWPTTETVCI